MEKMKAVVAYAPYDNRYEEYPKPEIGPGEILLKVKGCGICAGDLKAYHGGVRVWGTAESTRYIEPPCIPGHEFYGEIAAAADDVKSFSAGDRIVSEQIIPCGQCEFCRQGKYWMCRKSVVYGFKNYANGGFAEYVKLPATSINHVIPKSFTPEQSVLIEPVACGMHALEQAEIRHSDVVVISGLGAIGLSMCNITDLALPKMVIGIEMKEKRIRMAKEFGADIVLNPLECDVQKEVLRLTEGTGCDVYVEASGSVKSVRQGLEMLKNMGRYIQMGVLSDEVSADWNMIGDGKELKIIGSHLSGKTYDAVIRGMERGLIKTEGLISHRFPLKDWEKAFDTAENSPDAVKVMLIP